MEVIIKEREICYTAYAVQLWLTLIMTATETLDDVVISMTVTYGQAPMIIKMSAPN